jgi:FKBP-type peptidyl-prolyl cis-trans isomerase FklB
MKKYICILAGAALLVACGQKTENVTRATTPTVRPATTAAPTSVQLKDQKEKVSYSIGMQIGFNLARAKVEINPDIFFAGVKDSIAGNPRLTPDQVKDVMAQFEKDMEQKQKELAEKNKTEGAKFLEDNKKKPGVQTTASGLQYKVEKEGTGATPKATDLVTVNYRGTLIDGTEFDSSIKRGQPATFPVNGVIKGWMEALQLMKQGAKYQLFIPATLAYGERAMGPDIGPNSTLIFEVELQEVKPPPTPVPLGSPKAPAPVGSPIGTPAAPPRGTPPVMPRSTPVSSPSPRSKP